jgi:hypothetical protein
MNVHQRAGSLLAAVAVVALLGGCGGFAAPEPAPTAAPAAPSPTPTVAADSTAPRVRCGSGHLVVGDIPAVAEEWAVGVQNALERARAWRGDARMVALQVGCRPLEQAFRWEGRFYSDGAQAFFSSDTGTSTPAEVDPAAVATLPLDRVDFLGLHRSLARAGYADGAVISPTGGVTVRLNAATDPFGPPGTPQDLVYHAAIEDNGQTRDLFVSGANWTLFGYQDPA